MTHVAMAMAAYNSIDELDATLAALRKLAAQTEGDPRREIIRQRRRLADEIAAISAAGDAPYSSAAEQDMFRKTFAAMRMATSLHQASWPAVSVNPADAAYVESARRMFEAIRDFIDWSRGRHAIDGDAASISHRNGG